MTKKECQFIPLQDEELSPEDCQLLLNCWLFAKNTTIKPEDTEHVLNFKAYLFIHRLISVARDHIKEGFYYTEADNYLRSLQEKLGLEKVERNIFLNKIDAVLDSVDIDELLINVPEEEIFPLRDQIAILMPNPKRVGVAQSFSTELE
jgi:hypothetical protein